MHLNFNMNIKRCGRGFFSLLLLLLFISSALPMKAVVQVQGGPSIFVPEVEPVGSMEVGKAKLHEKGKRKAHRFNPEKFKHDLSIHIARKAEFTPEETKKFFPIFFEMKERQLALQRQKTRTLRNAAESDKNEKDCERVLDMYEKLEAKSMRIEKDYMKRLRSVVGARKLVKAMAADRVFGRRMFHQMTKKP